MENRTNNLNKHNVSKVEYRREKRIEQRCFWKSMHSDHSEFLCSAECLRSLEEYRMHWYRIELMSGEYQVLKEADLGLLTRGLWWTVCVLMCSASAVDRSVTASMSDARDALINAAIDSLASYRSSVLTVQQPGLLTPACLRLLPLYILALLKHVRPWPPAVTRRLHALIMTSSLPLPSESLPGGRQHPAGRACVCHVSAEAPAAGVPHDDGPSGPVSRGWADRWGQSGVRSVGLCLQ